MSTLQTLPTLPKAQELISTIMKALISLKCYLSNVFLEILSKYFNQDNVLEIQIMLFRSFEVIVEYLGLSKMKPGIWEWFKNVLGGVKLINFDHVLLFLNRIKEKCGELIMSQLSRFLSFVQAMWNTEFQKAFAYVISSVLLSGTLWGLMSGIILTKLLRNLVKKKTGISFRKIKLNPFLFRIIIADIDADPSESPLVQQILVSILPSADVVTETNKSTKTDKNEKYTPFTGSKLKVAKIYIQARVHLNWFVFLSKKRNEKAMNNIKAQGSEEDNNTISSITYDDIGLSDFKFRHTKKLMKLISELVKLVGIIPKISVRVKDVEVELNKTYIAPEPDFPKEMHEPIPTAILESNDSESKLPTFSMLGVGSFADEEIFAANKFSGLIDNWLDSFEWKAADDSTIASELNTSALDDSIYSSDGDESFASSKGSTQTVDEIRQKTKSVDPENALLQRSIRAILSALDISLENVKLVVSGADAKTITDARARLSPRFANKFIAETPSTIRALSVVGFKIFSLSFDGNDCNPNIIVRDIFVKVGFPESVKIKKKDPSKKRLRHKKRSSKKSSDTTTIIKFEWHDIMQSFDICLGLLSFHHILAWATSYDHVWPDREVGVSISITGNKPINICPKALHTLLVHWDDHADPNSPFQEWHAWCKKIHFSEYHTTQIEKLDYLLEYRQLLRRTKRWKHRRDLDIDNRQKSKNSLKRSAIMTMSKSFRNLKNTITNSDDGIVSKSTSNLLLNLSAMEQRMTRREILFMRYFDIMWENPRQSRTLKSFLKFCNSTIILDPREEEELFSKIYAQKSSFFSNDTKNASFDLHEEYTTTLDALLALLQMKSSLLAASFSLEVNIDFCSVEIPGNFITTKNEKPEDLFLNSVHFVSSVADNTSPASVTSTLCLEKIRLNFRTRMMMLSETIETDKESGIKQAVYFSLGKLRWDPVESSLPLPKFEDNSFCGLFYEKSENKSNSMVIADIHIESNPLRPDMIIKGSILLTEIVFILNPLPILSTIETMMQIINLPFKEIQNEEEAANASGALDKDDNIVYDSGTQFGTITNGIKADLNIKVSDCSILFLNDAKDLYLGCLGVSVEEMSVSINSEQENERLNFSLRELNVDVCRPVLSKKENVVELIFLPFKSVLFVEYVDISYEAQSSKLESLLLSTLITTSNVELRSDIPNQVVSVKIKLFVEPKIELNVSPIFFMSIKGTVNSLLEIFCPSAEETERKRLEEEQNLSRQRNIKVQQDVLNRKKLLRQIWEVVDGDRSNSLDHSEVRNVVKHVFSEDLRGQDIASRLTEQELIRETDQLITLLDPKYEENISFEELDGLLDGILYKENKKDMSTYEPDDVINNKYADSHHALYSQHAFGIIYYEDMREYSSMVELYRLTGTRNKKLFPPPSTWRQGAGIELFWEFYEKETGCTKNSLNGQDIFDVQSKLVRALCNYEFAKFCWKSLVYPELQTVPASSISNGVLKVRYNFSSLNRTMWMLDACPKLDQQTGAIEKVMQHVIFTQEKELKKTKMRQNSMFWYDVKFLCELDGMEISMGSSHVATRNIFKFEVSDISFSINTLIDFHAERGLCFVSFTKDKQTTDISNAINIEHEQKPIIRRVNAINIEHEQKPIIRRVKRAYGAVDYSGFSSGLDLHLEFMIYSEYLNTTHATTETFIELFPTFVNVQYNPVRGSDENEDEESLNDFSAAVELICPFYLNINISPPVLSIFGLMVDFLSNLTPQQFYDEAMNTRVELLRGAWDASATHGATTLNSSSLPVVLKNFFDSFTNAIEPLELEKRRSGIMNSLSPSVRPDENVKFEDLEIAVRRVAKKRNYHLFEMVGNIIISNFLGESINFSFQEESMDSNYIIQPGGSKTFANLLSTKNKYDSRISLELQDYKPINGILINVYYKSIIPLKPMKVVGYRRKSKRLTASGFEPCIVIDPSVDKYDSIRIAIKSCIKIKAHTPIDFRVLRLNLHSVDVANKHILNLLRDHCEYSPEIIFDKSGVSVGSFESLPLAATNSSHVHVLQFRDEHSWRMPIPLTKEFLHNNLDSAHISLCWNRCGISIQRTRLNINRPEGSKKRILKTSWETIIQINPRIVISNSLPFSVDFRCWQSPQESDDYDQMERDKNFVANDNDSFDEENEMEDLSSAKSSEANQSMGIDSSVAFSTSDCISIAENSRLNGMDMSHPMFIQIAQSDATTHLKEEGSLVWSSPVQINLNKLFAGGNPNGLKSLPEISVKLGDDSVFFIYVTVDRNGLLNVDFFANYYVVNKSGMKMMFNFSGWDKMPFDSGVGGIPILASCSVDKTLGKGKREMTFCPLENTVRKNVWWDTEANGRLIIKPPLLKKGSNKFVGWCDPIKVGEAGTPHEIFCKDLIFGVLVQSLTGIFQRSNLITISPRFILRNDLKQSITILTLKGNRENLKAMLKSRKVFNSYLSQHVILKPNESTIIYKFDDVSNYGISEGERFICMKVNWENNWKNEAWHLIAANGRGTEYFMQRIGVNHLVSSIISVERVIEGAKLFINIKDCDRPPYKVENRSNEFYLQFMQDDYVDCDVLELPPMSWCSFTWDNPSGKKKLKFIALNYDNSLAYIKEKEKQLESEFVHEEFSQESGSFSDNVSELGSLLQTSKADDNYTSSRKKLIGDSSYKSNEYLFKRRLYLSARSRIYDPSKPGPRKKLPCPNSTKINLHSEVRILQGCRILSFNDSEWRADQIQRGSLKSGGNFKNIMINATIEGVGINLVDDFPREICSVNIRDLSVHKASGRIDVTTRLRHFQIDAMSKSARYPIILSQKPLGVDERGTSDDSDSAKKDDNVFYWKQKFALPPPIFEANIEYIPQNNMIWLPKVQVLLSPIQVNVELMFFLNMFDLLINSLPTNIFSDDTDISYAFEQFTSKIATPLSRIQDSDSALCYVEKFQINPTWIELELDIRSGSETQKSQQHEVDDDPMMALNTIGRNSKSTLSAGLISWVGDVAAVFAHVSPKFVFDEIRRVDYFSHPVLLFEDLASTYTNKIILQSYKVLFSMHLLGNPTKLFDQYKTGVVDLFSETKTEVMAGGQKGFGKGFRSFLKNLIGGTFQSVSSITGGLADILITVTTNELTSQLLLPMKTETSEPIPHFVEGIFQGTSYLTTSVAHGLIGFVGNPYRGFKKKSIVAFGKGVYSGSTGLIASPFIGALGFTAKISEGVSENTRIFEYSVIECRCRPTRIVGWGSNIGSTVLPYLKEFGIRIHTVHYMRSSKKTSLQSKIDQEGDIKRGDFIRARKEQRKLNNPYSVYISMSYGKNRYESSLVKPKVFDDTEKKRLRHVVATFESTIYIRASDLQLSEPIVLDLCKFDTAAATSTKRKSIARCTLNIGDIYLSLMRFTIQHQEETKLSMTRWVNDPQFKAEMSDRAGSTKSSIKSSTKYGNDDNKVATPSIQEFSLMRNHKKRKFENINIVDAINHEISRIKNTVDDDENDAVSVSSSSGGSMNSYFLGVEREKELNKKKELLKTKEEVFGQIYMSFFPVQW